MTMHADAECWRRVYFVLREMGMGLPLGQSVPDSAEQFVKGLQQRMKEVNEANCLIIGAIECIETRKDYRLAVEKLREADKLTGEKDE